MTNECASGRRICSQGQGLGGQPSRSREAWLPDGPVLLSAPTRARVWMAGMMLGVAQAALDETIEFGKARSMTLGGASRSGMPGNQFAVADAAMAIE